MEMRAVYAECLAQMMEKDKHVLVLDADLSKASGTDYDTEWTTRQFGKKLCKEYGDGTSATVGDYVIRVKEDGGIETYRTYDNVKGALREIAEKVGFVYDTEWTTRQFGSKLVDALQ